MKCRKMKDIMTAFSETVSMYKPGMLEYMLIQHSPLDKLWVVNVVNCDAPGSLLQIEVIDDDGIPKCSVLQKVNVGRKSMFRFMDNLVEALE